MSSNGITAFLFATLKEAQPLLDRAERVQADLNSDDGSLFRPRLAGESYLLVISGMGGDATSHAARRLIHRHSVRRIVNVGIAGSLKTDVEIGEVFNIRRASSQGQHWHIASKGQLVPGRPDATLLSFDTPVFNQQHRQLLSRQGDLVDMEGAAVARVCAEQRVPCQLIKGVSDFAQDRAQLHANLHDVSTVLADCIVQSLKNSSTQRSCA